jgi:hypothetical protein
MEEFENSENNEINTENFNKNKSNSKEFYSEKKFWNDRFEKY